MRLKGSQQQLAERRQLAIKLLKEGMRGRKVAKVLGVTVQTVSRWKQKYAREGKAALKAAPHPHRESQLTPKMRQKLVRGLLQGPQSYGWKDQLWTLEKIAKVIEKEFGIRFHPCHVWRILGQMGWSCQKPQRIPREQDRKQVKKIREKTYPRLKGGKKDAGLH